MSKANMINIVRDLLKPDSPDYCVRINGKFYQMDNVNVDRWPWTVKDTRKHGQPKRPINGTHQVIRITPTFEIYF